ncbi:MAG: hypothetical protein AAF620_14160 [Bacteroidota bacterium]
MRYPFITLEESIMAKRHIIDFRDFYYTLDIQKGKGVDVSLHLGNLQNHYSGFITSDSLRGTLRQCLAWITKLKQQKIDPQDQKFGFFYMKKNTIEYFVAALKNKDESLILSQEIEASSVKKSLVVRPMGVEEVINMVMAHNRRKSVWKKEVPKWECYQSWDSLCDLLKALEQDVIRFDGKINNYSSITEKGKNELGRACRQLKIPMRFFKNNKGNAVEILNLVFFNEEAAKAFLRSIRLERGRFYSPSFRLFNLDN